MIYEQILISIDFIIESVFLGFAFYYILFTCLSAIKKINANQFIHAFDNSASYVLRCVGLLYAVVIGIYILSVFSPMFNDSDKFMLVNRMFGPYWFAFWIRPIIYLFATQFLWFNSINKSKWLKLILAFLILFIWNIEKFIIIVTSYHRDFLPSSWSIYSPFSVLDEITDIFIFLGATLLTHLFMNRKNLKLNT